MFGDEWYKTLEILLFIYFMITKTHGMGVIILEGPVRLLCISSSRALCKHLRASLAIELHDTANVLRRDLKPQNYT